MNDINLPNRKPTRLRGYDYSTNGAYFVTVCTQHREELFVMESVGNDTQVVPYDIEFFLCSL